MSGKEYGRRPGRFETRPAFFMKGGSQDFSGQRITRMCTIGSVSVCEIVGAWMTRRRAKPCPYASEFPIPSANSIFPHCMLASLRPRKTLMNYAAQGWSDAKNGAKSSTSPGPQALQNAHLVRCDSFPVVRPRSGTFNRIIGLRPLFPLFPSMNYLTADLSGNFT